MRKSLPGFLAVGVSSLILSGPVFAYDEWSWHTHWDVLAEYIWFKRARIHEHCVAVDNQKIICNPEPGECPDFCVLDTKDITSRFEHEPGFRVGIGYSWSRYSTLEARYMQIREWSAKKEAFSNNNLDFPFNDRSFTFDFTGAKKASARYKSSLREAELNYLFHHSPKGANYFSLSGIAGFRYDEINERFTVIFVKDFFSRLGQITPDTDVSSYRIETKNKMYGFQVGGDLQWNPMRWLYWEAIVKIGGMVNFAKNRDFLGDHNNKVVLRDFTKDETNGVLVTEADIVFGLQPVSYLGFHIGYEFLYFSGVALAPEQVNLNPNDNVCERGETIYLNGDPMYHGIFAGITLSF